MRDPTPLPPTTSPCPPGAVISAEPGIYLPGKLGVRDRGRAVPGGGRLPEHHPGPQGSGDPVRPVSQTRGGYCYGKLYRRIRGTGVRGPHSGGLCRGGGQGDPASPAARELVLRWRDHLAKFSRSCDEEKLRRLADLYSWDDRFSEVLDSYGPGTAPLHGRGHRGLSGYPVTSLPRSAFQRTGALFCRRRTEELSLFRREQLTKRRRGRIINPSDKIPQQPGFARPKGSLHGHHLHHRAPEPGHGLHRLRNGLRGAEKTPWASGSMWPPDWARSVTRPRPCWTASASSRRSC